MTMTYDPQAQSPPSATNRRGLIRSVLVNILGPAIVLRATTHALPVGSATPLLLSALVPAAWLASELARRRVLDVISVLALVQLAFSITAALLGGDLRSAVRIGALQNLGLALVFAGSAMVGRPLVRSLARQFLAGDDLDARRRLDASFAQPAASRSLMLLTWVWAGILAAAGLAACLAAAMIDPVRFRGIIPMADLALYAALIWGSIRYRRSRLEGST